MPYIYFIFSEVFVTIKYDRHNLNNITVFRVKLLQLKHVTLKNINFIDSYKN